ncbi:MAG: ribosome-associated heat shock protein Hsp15 [Marinobacterium sp.]|nr:ribosome-associated heat shock protein Hsp15 [Marinobacterium sp.]
MSESNEKIRLDKWLWAARFYKTRGIAKQMIEGGKVHYNGARSKCSRIVEIGAELTLRQGFDEKVVVIKALSDRRGPAPEAQTLYEETSASQQAREEAAAQRKLLKNDPGRRPDKKSRRLIRGFREHMDG